MKKLLLAAAGDFLILILAAGYRHTVIKVPPGRQRIVLHKQGSERLPDIRERADDPGNVVAFHLKPGRYDVIVRIQTRGGSNSCPGRFEARESDRSGPGLPAGPCPSPSLAPP